MSVNELNKIEKLATDLLNNLDEKVFFSKISTEVQNLFDEYKVQVFEAFFDGSSQLRAENGKATKSGTAYAKGQGLSGYVVRTKRAYYSNSAKRDPLLATSVRDEVVESELAVPVICEGTVLGTIHIQSDNSERKFAEEDIQRVNAFLTDIAAPIKNMRIYLLAKNLNKELSLKIEQKEKELELRGTVQINRPAISREKIELAGHSNAFLNIMNTARKVAVEDFPVLLKGESGTGKKLLAKKIHQLSNRKKAACVIAHCAAIDELALETELFGKAGRPGIFERANGGTIILDNVSELSIGTQGKILRAITSGEIHNIDSEQAIAVNVRIISTSREELSTAVEEGKFREDLLYRLNIVNVAMPSLRDRNEDIKVLSEHFLNLGKSRETNKILTSKAIEKLSQYNWPGNVQELKNIMERTYVLAEDRYIDEQHLPDFVNEAKIEEPEVEEFAEMTLHELEKKHIIRTLDHLAGNKTRAAKALGITVKTLYNKLHSYGLVISRSE